MIVSRTLRKIARYEFSNVARSRWLVPYTLASPFSLRC
jgi:hypothetical protein